MILLANYTDSRLDLPTSQQRPVIFFFFPRNSLEVQWLGLSTAEACVQSLVRELMKTMQHSQKGKKEERNFPSLVY